MGNRFAASGMIGIAGSIGMSMVPDKIGGTDLTGLKSIGNQVATFASFGRLLGPIGAAVGGLTGAVFGLKSWLDQSSNKKQQQELDALNKAAAGAKGMGGALDVYAKALPKPQESVQPTKITNTGTTSFGGFTSKAYSSTSYNDVIQAIKLPTDAQVKSYKELSTAAKGYGDYLAKFLQNVTSGNVKLKDYNIALQTLSKSSLNTAGSANAVALAIKKTQDPTLVGYLQTVTKNMDLSKTSASDLLTKLVGISGIDWSKVDKVIAEKTKAATSAASGPVDYSSQFKTLLKQYEGVRKLINAQTEAQKKYNDELKLTQEYQNKQMDYFNQMKQSFTSGNYLQAALFQQSALQNQASYRASLLEQKQQDALSAIDARIALIQEGSSSGLTLNQWLAKNKQFSTKVTNDQLIKLFTGLSTSKYTGNTSALITKAMNLQTQGAAISSGGPFNNLTIVVNADNSVVPNDFAATVAGHVGKEIQKTVAKNNKVNKINTPTRYKVAPGPGDLAAGWGK